MHLEMALKEALGNLQFTYYPMDVFPRNDDRVMICNLNSMEFPIGLQVDYIILQGKIADQFRTFSHNRWVFLYTP